MALSERAYLIQLCYLMLVSVSWCWCVVGVDVVGVGVRVDVVEVIVGGCGGAAGASWQ